MKEVPRSITASIVNDNEVLATSLTPFTTLAWIAEKAFGALPKGTYNVTYSLNAQGEYLIVATGFFVALLDADTRRFVKSVCFLPREWHGMCVSREVERS